MSNWTMENLFDRSADRLDQKAGIILGSCGRNEMNVADSVDAGTIKQQRRFLEDISDV